MASGPRPGARETDSPAVGPRSRLDRPGPGRAGTVEVPRAGAGEVTVEVLTSVVSTGTERAQYLSLPNTSVGFPHRPGYSAAGVVLAAGPDVSSVKPGDFVAVRNVPHMSVVTAPASFVYPVPAGVSEAAAAMVQLGVICGQGIRRAGIGKEAPFCVIGAGLIGVPVATPCQGRRGRRGNGGCAVACQGEDRQGRRGALSRGGCRHGGDRRARRSRGDRSDRGSRGSLARGRGGGSGGRIVLLGSPRGVTRDAPVSAIRAKRLRVTGAHVSTLGNESRLTGSTCTSVRPVRSSISSLRAAFRDGSPGPR